MAGVRYYTRATLAVYFPEQDVCCHNCCLGYRIERGLYKCPFTGQLNFEPDRSRQEDCPLKIEGDTRNDNS